MPNKPPQPTAGEVTKEMERRAMKYETVYRIHWDAGSRDLPSEDRAVELVNSLMAVGISGELIAFERPK